jgi:hypothetical protein
MLKKVLLPALILLYFYQAAQTAQIPLKQMKRRKSVRKL